MLALPDPLHGSGPGTLSSRHPTLCRRAATQPELPLPPNAQRLVAEVAASAVSKPAATFAKGLGPHLFVALSGEHSPSTLGGRLRRAPGRRLEPAAEPAAAVMSTRPVLRPVPRPPRRYAVRSRMHSITACARAGSSEEATSV
jgi:hypothetical protein